MKTTFKSQNLWELVENGGIDSSDDQERDAKAIFFIQQAMNESILSRIATTTTFIFKGARNFSFSQYGDYWRRIRKICSQELLSPTRVQSFGPALEEEVSNFIKSAFGMKCKDQEWFIELVKEASAAAAGFHISDLFPSSTLLPKLKGFKTKLEDEDLVDVLLRYEGEDLVDVLLRYQDDVEFHCLLLICVNNIKSIPITPRFALNQPPHVLFYYQCMYKKTTPQTGYSQTITKDNDQSPLGGS
ncbi:cytochrome P450 71D11-like protein [Tanacetum coccineum]